MKLAQPFLKAETAKPLVAMAVASAGCAALVGLRIGVTGNIRYAFLLWNLFLAWLPLVFALLLLNRFQSTSKACWRVAGLGAVWLVFFPNAPYILTDIIHLAGRYYQHFWVDLVVILLCAFTGLLLGFVSLYLMQGVVRQLVGRAASWGFIAIVTALSSLGVYLGRFLRFNSWDVLTNPGALYRSVGSLAGDPLANLPSWIFCALFAVFLFLSYLMLYALTHLRQPQYGIQPEAAGAKK